MKRHQVNARAARRQEGGHGSFRAGEALCVGRRFSFLKGHAVQRGLSTCFWGSSGPLLKNLPCGSEGPGFNAEPVIY